MKLRSLFFVFALLALAGLHSLSVSAQNAYAVRTYAPDLSQFPRMSIFFDLFNPTGDYVSNLLPESLNLLENGNPVPLEALELLPQGLQITIAVNPGPAMAVRDISGASRYEKVSQALTTWAQNLPSENSDRLSLVSTIGPLHTLGTPATWLENFQTYVPNLRNATPNLQSLTAALTFLEENPADLGQKRALLLITPHIDATNLVVYEDLSRRAQALNARVFVWMLDSVGYASHPSAQGMRLLAAQTGGAFFFFSGSENLPEPEIYFSHLRNTYALTYNSRVNTSGEQTLTVQITSPADGQQITAQTVFTTTVLPPNPVFLSPPFQIIRQLPEGQYDIEGLLPVDQELNIIIEFPDGYAREITRTTLLVDGKLADENTSAPFEQFTWSLREYLIGAEHSLTVEVEDSLGLTQTSLSVPVTVTVIQPPRGFRVFLARNQWFISLATILLAGLAVGLIIFISVRLRLAKSAAQLFARFRKVDPLTQPVTGYIEPRGRKTEIAPLGIFSRRRKNEVAAFLSPIDHDGNPLQGTTIPLGLPNITFGLDPAQSLHVLDDPSVANLHARIHFNGKESYTLFDQNSLSGTWINLQPVPAQGRLLHHGDIIHFGQLAFRFTLRSPKPEVPIKITLEDDPH